MDDIFHHYQPVFDIRNWKVMGVESLVRHSGMNPEAMIREAKNKGMLYEFDLRSIQKAIQTYIEAGYHFRNINLFLNVFPSTIVNPSFHPFLSGLIEHSPIAFQQIVLELNEREIYNPETLTWAVIKLKEMGVRIALDDYGIGFANFKTLVELQPHFVKLDKYFIGDLKNLDRKKNAIITILYYCKLAGIELIVEGVEDSVGLAIIKSLGVKFAQGFLLGKPDSIK